MTKAEKVREILAEMFYNSQVKLIENDIVIDQALSQLNEVYKVDVEEIRGIIKETLENNAKAIIYMVLPSEEKRQIKDLAHEIAQRLQEG